MSRWAAALATAALVLAAGCGSDDTDPAAHTPATPGVSNPTPPPVPPVHRQPDRRIDPRCSQTEGLAVALPVQRVREPAAEVTPDCSGIDPAPFGIPPLWRGPHIDSV